MSKIKPKKGWSVYSKPWAPSKPHEPKKTYIDHDRQEIGSVGLSEGDDNSYSELQIPLPEGVNPDNVVFVFTSDYSDGHEHTLRFYNKSPREVENPHYEREMKYYKKALEKYEADKATHKEDLKVWKEWVAQEQEAQLQRNLKHAEDLLKKHGRLIKDES
jgi:hypothetical protein